MNYLKTLLLLFIFTFSLSAQELGVWKNYSDMKFVNNVIHTADGFWTATSGGAFYYSANSNSIENFLTKSEGLSSQNLTAIEIDNENRVWFGTQNGIINVYNPVDGSVKKILDINRSNFSQKQINDFLIIGDTVIVSIDFGISLIDSRDFSFIETVTKFGNFSSGIKVNSVSLENILIISTVDGVAIQKTGSTNISAPESWTSYFVGTDIPAGTTFQSVFFNDRLIVGTDDGLVQFNQSVWSKYANYNSTIFDLDVSGEQLIVLLNNSLNSFDGLNNEIIYSSLDLAYQRFDTIEEAEFLIATNVGVLNLIDDLPENIVPNGPINNSFQSVAVDSRSNLWTATGKDAFGMGFMKFDGAEWTNYNTFTFDGLPTNAYFFVSADDKNVYLSSWGSGFAIENNNEFEFFTAANSELIGVPWSPSFVVIRNVTSDSKDNLWIFNHLSADDKPILQLTVDSVWYHYEFPFFKLTEDIFINTGVVDQYDTKWFSVANRGLYYFNEMGTSENENDDVWGSIRESDGLNSNEIQALAVDLRGEIWIGTSKGVNIILDPTNPKSRISSVFSLRQQSITSIAVDPLNNKWVGTHQGVFVMTPDGSQLIAQYDSKNSPLSSDDITSIAVDDNTGLAYIGTSFGLSSLTTASVKPKESFDEIFVYPNPFVVGNSDIQLTIDGLVRESQIKILTINGTLVNEFSTPGGRIAFWDGKDSDGKYVSSGIYILVAYDEEADNVATAKIAVIRE